MTGGRSAAVVHRVRKSGTAKQTGRPTARATAGLYRKRAGAAAGRDGPPPSAHAAGRDERPRSALLDRRGRHGDAIARGCHGWRRRYSATQLFRIRAQRAEGIRPDRVVGPGAAFPLAAARRNRSVWRSPLIERLTVSCGFLRFQQPLPIGRRSRGIGRSASCSRSRHFPRSSSISLLCRSAVGGCASAASSVPASRGSRGARS